MAVTDYKYAGTAANVDRDGKADWNNPDNAKADDANKSSTNNIKNTYSDWLRLTNFGFSSADIPDGSTINGIEFVIKRSVSNDPTYTRTDHALYLYDDGAVGNNMASGTNWPVSPEAEATYGGATDMCGTSLTQADIVTSTFGIQLSVYSNNSSGSVFAVNSIKIRVYYTEGGGATSLPTRLFKRNYNHILVR
jgi:hypothetical protein